MNKKQPIAVLGGMGPQASSAFYKLLIDRAVSQHGVVRNEDFPYILLQSLPVPDFISSRDRQQEAIVILREAMKRAAEQDPVVVGMACNTAHLFLKELLEVAPGVRFVSMIDTVVNRVSNDGLKRVGLVASPTTIQTGLYAEALSSRDIDCLVPSPAEQAQLETIIRAVIAGDAGKQEVLSLRRVSLKLLRAGAERVILGCTELPLVAKQDTDDYPRYDSLELLADALQDRYYERYAILEGK